MHILELTHLKFVFVSQKMKITCGHVKKENAKEGNNFAWSGRAVCQWVLHVGKDIAAMHRVRRLEFGAPWHEGFACFVLILFAAVRDDGVKPVEVLLWMWIRRVPDCMSISVELSPVIISRCIKIFKVHIVGSRHCEQSFGGCLIACATTVFFGRVLF